MRDDAAWLKDLLAGRHRPVTDGDRAGLVVRAHVLGEVDAVAAGLDAPFLLVKGAALALTAYAHPSHRPMVDVDVVVPGAWLQAAGHALERLGYRAGLVAGRPWSGSLLGEAKWWRRFGELELLVELHVSLDKAAPRDLSLEELLTRSRPAPGYRHLRVPSAEDHLLLVVLHHVGHGFRHLKALGDVETLLQGEPDVGVVVERARRWGLSTALWVTLESLRAAGSARVPPSLVEAVRPSRRRRHALRAVFRVGAVEPAPPGRPRPWRWVLEQGLTRDDHATWLKGMVRYAAARVVERATTPQAPRPPGPPPPRRPPGTG
jgi:hypothetical protein